MKAKKRPIWVWMAMNIMTIVMILLMSSSVMDALAAEVQTDETEVGNVEMTAEEMLKSIFSLQYYAEHNPDVVAMYGYNYDALYQHYIGCGIHEGRDVSPIVNLRLYRDFNPDLLETYGDDFMGVLLHFTEKGIYETVDGLRQSTGVRFNPVSFLREHPEAELLTEGNFLKAAEMFIYEGMPDGKWKTSEVAVEDVQEEIVTVNSISTATMSTFAMVEQSSSDESSEEVSRPAETEQPSAPVEVPCDHPSVICGEKCSVCGVTISHDFGASGTDPYCSRCNASYVQVNGCNHPSWNGGACTVCKKVDPYYQMHGDYYEGESCPECGYQGTKPRDEEVTSPENGENSSGKDTNDGDDSQETDAGKDDLKTDTDAADSSVDSDTVDAPGTASDGNTNVADSAAGVDGSEIADAA